MDTERQLKERISELESELAKRVREAAENEQQLERYAADLRETFKEERARAQELRQSYMLTVRALASAVEARDADTGRHAERVAAYGLQLADAYGMHLGDDPEIEFGFLLHDAGKVAVPDAILFKPGPLSPAERLIIEQHPVTGSEIVRDIDFLGAARDVIRHHHERWDGTGYPDKLAGEEIPISARIFAVADTLDALTTNRPYRRASTIAQARVIILQAVGSHFDPGVIEAFKLVSDVDIERIKLRIG
ncbi:MAG TPA: HD domain-containing phosphohydrolase [Solirubrobacteraceae bacterium]|nr:HD domain-containing phosphohydrolase [Solirubrobacteraceae bacterium]